MRDPQDAQSRGIAIVNQELSLVPTCSQLRTISISVERTSRRYHQLVVRRPRAPEVLDELGLQQISSGRRSIAADRGAPTCRNRQAAGARCAAADREPTATLKQAEIEHVFRATRELVARGHAVIFVSHRLDRSLSSVTASQWLRDGRVVGTHAIEEIDRRTPDRHDHQLRDGGRATGCTARTRRTDGRSRRTGYGSRSAT